MTAATPYKDVWPHLCHDPSKLTVIGRGPSWSVGSSDVRCGTPEISFASHNATYIDGQGNYVAIRTHIEKIDWKSLFKDKNCSECLNEFMNVTQQCMDLYIPKRDHTAKRNKPVSMDKSTHSVVKKKHSSYCHYLTVRTSEAWKDYKKARNHCTRAIKRFVVKYEKSIASNSRTNHKTVYKYINSKLKKKRTSQ